MRKVTAFIGEKASLLAIYNEIKGQVSADIYCKNGMSELKVEITDYVKAIALGSEVVRKNGLNHVAWISPCGSPIARFSDTATETAKKVESGIMPAFTSLSAIEIQRVAKRLDDVNIGAIATTDEKGYWQIVVKPEEYLEAVAIGAKFIDGCNLKNVVWNDPTGVNRFNMESLARTARTELDDVLEA